MKNELFCYKCLCRIQENEVTVYGTGVNGILWLSHVDCFKRGTVFKKDTFLSRLCWLLTGKILYEKRKG
jgi:hypothetical protein